MGAKIYDSTQAAFVDAEPKIYIGSAFADSKGMSYNGSEWEEDWDAIKKKWIFNNITVQSQNIAAYTNTYNITDVYCTNVSRFTKYRLKGSITGNFSYGAFSASVGMLINNYVNYFTTNPTVWEPTTSFPSAYGNYVSQWDNYTDMRYSYSGTKLFDFDYKDDLNNILSNSNIQHITQIRFPFGCIKWNGASGSITYDLIEIEME